MRALKLRHDVRRRQKSPVHSHILAAAENAPSIHQLNSPVKKLGPEVGCFGFVWINMVERRFSHFVGKLGRFSYPIAKARACNSVGGYAGVGRVQNLVDQHNAKGKAPQTSPNRNPKVNALTVGSSGIACSKAGAAYRTRTCDPRITNAMLYQLS